MKTASKFSSVIVACAALAMASISAGCGAPETASQDDSTASEAHALFGPETYGGWLSPGDHIDIPFWSGRSGNHAVRLYTKDNSYCTLQIQIAYKHLADSGYSAPFVDQTLCAYVTSPFQRDLWSGTPDVGYQITVTNRAAAATAVFYQLNSPLW